MLKVKLIDKEDFLLKNLVCLIDRKSINKSDRGFLAITIVGEGKSNTIRCEKLTVNIQVNDKIMDGNQLLCDRKLALGTYENIIYTASYRPTDKQILKKYIYYI